MKRFSFFVFLILLFLLPQAQAADRSDLFMQGPVRGDVVDVLDGDTLTIKAHIWIGQSLETHVRLYGIDAPEIKGKCTQERQLAQQAKAELARLVQAGSVSLLNIQLEKYAGRVMAQVQTTDGTDVSKHLIEKGLARPYGGKKRQSWCTQ